MRSYITPSGNIRCITCRQYKPLSKYERAANSATGYRGQCKNCRTRYLKSRRDPAGYLEHEAKLAYARTMRPKTVRRVRDRYGPTPARARTELKHYGRVLTPTERGALYSFRESFRRLHGRYHRQSDLTTFVTTFQQESSC